MSSVMMTVGTAVCVGVNVCVTLCVCSVGVFLDFGVDQRPAGKDRFTPHLVLPGDLVSTWELLDCTEVLLVHSLATLYTATALTKELKDGNR